MIIHLGATMPPKLVLQAIDEILSQSKATAEQQADISLVGSGGSASFANAYQFQLFALLPTLHLLDESGAKQLLDQNQDLQAKLQQYPQGINSLMPPPQPGKSPQGGGSGNRTQTRFTISGNPGPAAGGKGPAPGAGVAPDYLRQETQRKMQDIAQEGESDPIQAIAHSLTLPVNLDDGPALRSPRAEALEAIARANMKKNPGGAEAALSELRKVIGDLPPRTQVQYLSSAADIYLQMEEKDKADRVVGEGFKVADKLLEKDADPNAPNEALKTWWPSTDAYRRFVEVETKISRHAALNVLKEIKDPEIRAMESIMFARSLLGLPLKRVMVVEKRGDSTSSFTTDNN